MVAFGVLNSFYDVSNQINTCISDDVLFLFGCCCDLRYVCMLPQCHYRSPNDHGISEGMIFVPSLLDAR